jgi:heat-inducible transcriptional repressor
MASSELSDRERRILEAIVRSYVETAEPAGSRTISRRSGLGVSPATIRNTMSDLEDRGFLFHPHPSAGRMAVRPLGSSDRIRLAEELSAGGSAIESILRRAAQSLGVLTQELGVALGPQLDQTILERLEIVRLSAAKLILVLTLRGGTVRTIFVEVPGEIADEALSEVQLVLNERLAGLSLADIRASLGARLRDVTTGTGSSELLNIFLQEGETLFDVAIPDPNGAVVLGQASLLAEKPEFASGERMRQLIELTETRTELATLLRNRSVTSGLQITIGSENGNSLPGGLTVVTAEYHAAGLSGVIGVIGPTRMSYDKVIALVTHTSSLVTELLAYP